MPSPQPRVTQDLLSIRRSIEQAYASPLVPAFIKTALASALRVIESHEHELQALRDDVRQLKREAASRALAAGGEDC